MKILLFLLTLSTSTIFADLKTPPPVHPFTAQQGQTPSAINVNFTMGNSQEAPTKNEATATSTRVVQVEHKMGPIPQDSWYSKITNSFISGAVTAAASVIVHKIAENSDVIIEVLKKIVTRG